YGLDVARLGTDSTVLAWVCGGVVRVPWSVHGADLMRVVAKAAETVDEAPAPVWVDATGLGAGVLDRLRELGYNAKEFIAAARARRPDRFVNLKAESWWHARELFREGLVDLDPADKVLAGQLASVRYSLSSGGKVEIVSKRAMTGPSPDRADALVIALWGARGGEIGSIQIPIGQIPDSILDGKAPAVRMIDAKLRERGGEGLSPGIAGALRRLPPHQRRLVIKSLRRPDQPQRQREDRR
ncbi:MAG: hypothetical protein ACRDNK_09955, partial [Solirubrobacteraceae bacterium]